MNISGTAFFHLTDSVHDSGNPKERVLLRNIFSAVKRAGNMGAHIRVPMVRFTIGRPYSS